MDSRPTDDAYSELQRAFDYFNGKLFDSALPPVLLTLQRHRKTYGYFSAERFGRRDGVHSHELAINPVYFAVTPLEEVLSTLVHEQAHLWQQEQGKPGRRGYHNREFAEKMKAIGLNPSTTGKEGGKETGERMDHYIIQGGAFQLAARELLEGGFALSWYDRYPPADARPKKPGGAVSDGDDPGDSDDVDGELEAGEGDEIAGDFVDVAPNRSNRIKYTCEGCKMNVWGKPELHIKCGPCGLDLVPAE